MLKNFISIVICTYSLDRFNMTVDCINSIFDNTYKNYEIIVVVDGNRELKQKIESQFNGTGNLTIIENIKNEGPSISRNRGAISSKGDIVAFIDDDAIASPDWLEKIIKNFSEYPRIMVCGGKLIPLYEKGARKIPDELLWIVGCTYKGHASTKQYVRNVISANMAVKKQIFDDINFEKMFDKKLWKMEDTLFGIRLSMKEKNLILYDPGMIVYHNVTIDRTRLKYVIQRACSEGTLKYELSRIIRTNFMDRHIFYQEQNYLKILLYSIFRNIFSFQIKNSILIFLVMMSVIYSYSIRIIIK